MNQCDERLLTVRNSVLKEVIIAWKLGILVLNLSRYEEKH